MTSPQSPILPVTNPFVRGRSEEPTMPMLLQKHKDGLSTNGILLSSYFPPPSSSSSSSYSYLGDDQSSYTEARPLLSRAFSYDGITATTPIAVSPVANGHHNFPKKQRRRRTSSHDSLPILSDRRHSPSSTTPSLSSTISQNVGHAAAETYLVTRLSLTLLRFLGVGYRWITRFLALGCYAILLMPGFIQVGYYYVFSSQVRRSIVYGDQPRNRLDLYLPKNSNGPKPVVAFITGGAWIIGYKAWGSLLGRQLSERDIIVACIDYRNFPQGTIGDMVNDASQGISFVCNHIAEYGGDPNRIYLMGQSAGAHIASCALIEQAIKEAGEGMSVSWSVSQIKAYFGLSGGYNLLNLVDHFNSRGLYRSIFLGIMEGEQSLHRYSPEIVVQDPSIGNAPSLLPPIYLFHGTSDYSIPPEASESFVETLRSIGVKAEAILYEGKTHTDLFLQDPMRGGKDDLFDDIITLIHGGDEEALAKDVVATPRRRLVPEIMLRGARAVSPF